MGCLEDGGSDEEDCSIISVDDSYLKHFPAPPPSPSDTHNPVFVAIDVFSILSISEVQSAIRVQFQLNMTWMDSRITFRNLKPAVHQNSVNLTESGVIWLPSVIFYNTENKSKSKVGLSYLN